MAVVGFLVMSVVAIFQTDIRRMLAYSSIAQVGYILSGIAMANQAGLSSSLIHIVKMPITTSAFALGGISLIGMPLTAGFISKWNIISAALNNDWWWLAILILMSSVLAVIYIGRVIQMTCFSPQTEASTASKKIKEAPTMMWVSTWILLIASHFNSIVSNTIYRYFR